VTSCGPVSSAYGDDAHFECLRSEDIHVPKLPMRSAPAKLTSGGRGMDSLWYKDAIIYETHVKAFYDSDGNGAGDFPGMLQKLDYVKDLGVTAVWLLPFFPSPQRDDGYDIADYTAVHPSYGTLEDFKVFLDAAHDRDLQVIIELVINHTSDQHPWFQAARHAAPDSPERAVYVWSDTDQKYSDARIIFTDTEKSNWTWDPIAKAYYWHRFFAHQPDLNYDNPEVLDRVLAAMRFWLDLGVDGLRLDAIPYLAERDGTSCENLPESHTIIKRIRREIDEKYAGRMMLAEANQWPTDVRPYFGDGDECHMAFHFPLMPRMFMALRMEDRHPITDIMAQTPEIPPNCQWGLFLRNHDELTLEMVTEDERDYMYLAYSADPKMKINVGIRRRLAPLMENNVRRIELLNSLLFSFPGTPILYYGDEIGMGDNIYLGDRNGVRTPMQWGPDRNGGFSRANPAQLYSPLIMDPVYGYEAVNVEAQLSDSSSLLHWMRNMIELRKLFKVFGRGTIEFLHAQNRKVLAYTRSYQNDLILCVANLSRFGQAVELDLSAVAGMRPVEMFGYTEFPTIGRAPYPLTLNPYGFFWFELQGAPEPLEVRAAPPAEPATVLAVRSWQDLFESSAGEDLEARILPPFLVAQRWFAGKSQSIDAVRIQDWAELAGANARSTLVLLRVRYVDGAAEDYFVPLSLMRHEDAAAALDTLPERALGGIDVAGKAQMLVDGALDDDACRALLDIIENQRELGTRRGSIRAWTTSSFAGLRDAAGETPTLRRGSAEQSNTSIFFGERLMLKLCRKLEPGVNPELEIGRYLTEQVRFDAIPALAGAIEYVAPGEAPHTLAILQAVVANQGDGWSWTLEELGRYYEHCAAHANQERLAEATTPAASAGAEAALGISLEAAATLGRRTAQLHAALAASTSDPAFAPEPIEEADLLRIMDTLRQNASASLDLMQQNLSSLPPDSQELVAQISSRRQSFMGAIEDMQLPERAPAKIRVHGDYHLGQVLRVKNDYVIIDFEGEPARSIAERRAKYPAHKDVAGMLRSFSYAAHAGLLNYSKRRPDELQRLGEFARLWEQRTTTVFLAAYTDAAAGAVFLPADAQDAHRLLRIFLLDKAFYELQYELNHRPTWTVIPLRALLEILSQA
jgi:maltose alpha-D-glucosyltransferase/alpha-amylase